MKQQQEEKPNGDPPRFVMLGQWIGRLRLVVLIPVLAVLLAALSLFVLGSVQAVTGVWIAWSDVFEGGVPPDLSVSFLKNVIVVLEAVAFFLIGVGLYSLFIAPLNLAIALGVHTLHDLEDRVVRIVVVILAVTFLERFIQWQEPLQTLQFAGAMAAAVAALVVFQFYARTTKEETPAEEAVDQRRSKKQMFEHDREEHKLKPASGMSTESAAAESEESEATESAARKRRG
ncbi:MAG: YqhA family protein [Burkholderiaceae bacterium]